MNNKSNVMGCRIVKSKTVTLTYIGQGNPYDIQAGYYQKIEETEYKNNGTIVITTTLEPRKNPY